MRRHAFDAALLACRKPRPAFPPQWRSTPSCVSSNILLLDQCMRASIPGASRTETPHPTRFVLHYEAPSQIMDLRHTSFPTGAVLLLWIRQYMSPTGCFSGMVVDVDLLWGSHTWRCYPFSIDAGRPAGVTLARARQVLKKGIWLGMLNGETSWVLVRLPYTSERRG